MTLDIGVRDGDRHPVIAILDTLLAD